MIHVAQIGCGYWGPNLLRNFRSNPSCHVSVVADPNEESLARIQDTYPDQTVTCDTNQVLDDPSIDAVVIAAPARLHHALAKSAIQAGKDVLVEKPLALTHREGLELVEAADAAGRILMVGHILEYHPAIRKIRDILDQGDIGHIQYMTSSRLNLGKIRSEENVLWSFAPHDIAILQRFAGGPPAQVMATGSTFLQENTPDTTHSHLFFPGGTHAHIHVSWLHPFKEQRLVIVGSETMLTYNDVRKELLLYPHTIDISCEQPAIAIRSEPQPIPYPQEEPLALECEGFLRAIQTRQAPLTDGRSGLDVLLTLQALQHSMDRDGERTALDDIASQATSCQT